jgi:hypothetical protein
VAVQRDGVAAGKHEGNGGRRLGSQGGAPEARDARRRSSCSKVTGAGAGSARRIRLGHGRR